MRGGIGYQITRIFKESGIFQPGRSKHEDKAAAREKGASTWHDLGRVLVIYSYCTAEAYKDAWHRGGDYWEETMKLRDMEKLDESHILAYLEKRIGDGIMYSSFQLEAAAMGKLEKALNLYAEKAGTGRYHSFAKAIEIARAEARLVLPRNKASRHYDDPRGIIASMDRADYRLAAAIQLEGGARLSCAALIEAGQLRGIAANPASGLPRGVIHLENTKGGKPRDIYVSPETYELLAAHIKGHGVFHVDKDAYREALAEACLREREEYNGSHGLRWNFAEGRVKELMEQGYSYEEALLITAHEMGHERGDITQHYLIR